MSSSKTSWTSDYGSMQDSLEDYSKEELISMAISEREQRLELEKGARKQRKFTEELNEEIKQRSELASIDQQKIESLEKSCAQKDIELKEVKEELQKLRDAMQLDSKIKGGFSHLVVIEGELERCKRLNSDLFVELNSQQTLVEKLHRKLSERIDTEKKHSEREKQTSGRSFLDPSIKKHRKHRHGHHKITLSESHGKKRDHTEARPSPTESLANPSKSTPNFTEIPTTSNIARQPSSTETLKGSEENFG